MEKFPIHLVLDYQEAVVIFVRAYFQSYFAGLALNVLALANGHVCVEDHGRNFVGRIHDQMVFELRVIHGVVTSDRTFDSLQMTVGSGMLNGFTVFVEGL